MADERKKEMVKAIRDDYKKLIRGIADKYYLSVQIGT